MNTKARIPYNVPEGYFEGLKIRLGEIPSAHPLENVSRKVFWTRIRPYIAIAACMALFLTAGTFILRREAGRQGPSEDLYEEIVISDMVPSTDPDLVLGAPSTGEADEISDDDIINYLISSRASAELVAYAGYQ